MTELRWLERVDPYGNGRVYCNERKAWVVRVLQYREVIEKWRDAGAGYETATQWRDVPTVSEQEQERVIP